MSINEESLNTTAVASYHHETESEVERLTCEQLEKRIKANLEPLNKQTSDLTKLLQMISFQEDTENSQAITCKSIHQEVLKRQSFRFI